MWSIHWSIGITRQRNDALIFMTNSNSTKIYIFWHFANYRVTNYFADPLAIDCRPPGVLKTSAQNNHLRTTFFTLIFNFFLFFEWFYVGKFFTSLHYKANIILFTSLHLINIFFFTFLYIKYKLKSNTFTYFLLKENTLIRYSTDTWKMYWNKSKNTYTIKKT